MIIWRTDSESNRKRVLTGGQQKQSDDGWQRLRLAAEVVKTGRSWLCTQNKIPQSLEMGCKGKRRSYALNPSQGETGKEVRQGVMGGSGGQQTSSEYPVSMY